MLIVCEERYGPIPILEGIRVKDSELQFKIEICCSSLNSNLSLHDGSPACLLLSHSSSYKKNTMFKKSIGSLTFFSKRSNSLHKVYLPLA